MIFVGYHCCGGCRWLRRVTRGRLRAYAHGGGVGGHTFCRAQLVNDGEEWQSTLHIVQLAGAQSPATESKRAQFAMSALKEGRSGTATAKQWLDDDRRRRQVCNLGLFNRKFIRVLNSSFRWL